MIQHLALPILIPMLAGVILLMPPCGKTYISVVFRRLFCRLSHFGKCLFIISRK